MTLPENGLLREKDIIGDKRANPPTRGLLPISRTSWWCGVRSGRYPQPVKLGARITAWRLSDILALIEQGAK